MKAIHTFVSALAMIAGLTVMTGCQKSALDTMTGSYTYKTSGMVGLVPTQLIGTGLPMDTTWVALTPEQGQINIVTKDSEKSEIIVTWNDLLGNACSTGAILKDNTFTLVPNTKTATLTDGTDTLGGGFVTFSGTGTLYDNMLIITLAYKGNFTISSIPMTAVASKVECIAKAN